ncbi:MAG: hypothetical protein HXK66_04700 [Clostridiales bacterium]|nr:hypothetical protein [Clostridiales bacterium]
MPKHGIVNVRMVITEEKILSNIDKVQRIINPKSKKQIIELDGNSYFKDLIESIKTYLIEYPKKKNFPKSVYDQAYRLIEYATNQFEVSTKQVEELVKQKEYNIKSASILKQTIALAESKDATWKKALIEVSKRLSPEILEAVNKIGNAENKETEEYQATMKMLNARILNLQSNLHIEIDIERYEDRLKALSYIGIEISDALKTIPMPADSELNKQKIVEKAKVEAPKKVTTQNVPTQVQQGQRIITQRPVMQATKQVTNQVNKVITQQPIQQFTSQANKVTIQQASKPVAPNVVVKQQVAKAYPDQSVEPKVQLANVASAQQANMQRVQPVKPNKQVIINQPQFAKVEPIKIAPITNNNVVAQNQQVRQPVQQATQINTQRVAPVVNNFVPQQNIVQNTQSRQNNQYTQFNQPMMEMQYETKKPSFWERLKNSKLVRAIKFLFGSKNATLALPEAQTGYNRY